MSKLAIDGGEKVRTAPLPGTGDSSGRDIGDEELANLTQVIRSGKLFRHGGTFVAGSEQALAERLGVRHAVAVSSGTAAIHTALGALGIDAGSEVITTGITDMGTVAPIIFQNCIPVFADLDPDYFTLLPESVEARITDKTRAIIVVHLFGGPADMDAIMRIARKRGIAVIEDCAQAHLAEYNGSVVGTIGDIGCFSLQQSKQITAGEGGYVVTDDDALASRARLFSDKGWNRGGEPRDYVMLGTNYRMGELAGAVAAAQVSKLDSIVARRRAAADRLTSLISDVPGVIPAKVRPGCRSSWWLYPMMIDEQRLACSPKQFAGALSAEGIPAGQGYIGRPIFTAPFLQSKTAYGRTRCPFGCELYGREISYQESDTPNTMEILRRLITLPINEFFTEKDVDDIAEGIRKVAQAYDKKQGAGQP